CLGYSLFALGAGAELETKANPAIEKLQGTWRLVTLEVEGMPVGPEALKGSRIVVKGDTFTAIGMGAIYGGVLKVDESHTPKTLDMVFTEGPEKGNTSLAIYEVDGDHWKICLGLTNKTRPERFVSAPGSGHALETLEREADAPVPGTLKTEVGRLQGEW